MRNCFVEISNLFHHLNFLFEQDMTSDIQKELAYTFTRLAVEFDKLRKYYD